jgi:hypothetical protein
MSALIVLGLALIALGALLALAAWRRSRGRRRARLEIEARARGHTPETFRQTLDRLPAPVSRYLENALPPRTRSLCLARYAQTGTLRADARRGRWMPFTATEVIGANTAEFQWTARVMVAPLIHLQVVDSLLGGVGGGTVALLSALPLGSTSNRIELSSGSLHRFLAEAVWYPSALLPSERLAWTSIDDSRALAALTVGELTVSLEFRFGADDTVTGIYTPARWGSFDGGYAQRPWEGQFGSYRRRGGVLVPNEDEVGWHLDGRRCSVWRGAVTHAELEFR